MRTERHVRYQRKAEHQAETEANEMCIVVNHRQKTGHKEEDGDARQPAESPAQACRVVRAPVGKYFNKEAGEDSKLRARWTRLQCTFASDEKMMVLISQLPNLFGGIPRICNCILLLITWVRSFSKRLPSVTFAEEKVLIFLILREKC